MPAKKKKAKKAKPRPWVPPNYTRNGSSFGGNSSEHYDLARDPDGRLHYWFTDRPDCPKRKVTIEVSKFYGDTHHWYATIKEEDDAIWIPPDGTPYNKEGTWWSSSNGDCRGEHHDGRFNTEAAARAFVDLICRDFFNDGKHELLFESRSGRQVQWIYKEGD